MAALAALCALAPPLLAQSRTDHWVSHGPYMAPGVTALVADSAQASATLFASTPQGLFRSTDSGNSWQPVGEAFFLGLQISSLSVDPLRPGALYAIVGRSLPSTGLAKTTDGGQTWTWIFEPHDMTDSGNWPLAVDPQREGVLYLGFPGLGASSLSKSTDGGATWVFLPEFPAQVLIESLAADPVAADTLYAGTAGAGIFKTTDGAQTWTPANADIWGPDPNVTAIAVAGGANSRIYALVDGQAYRSDDGAATWRPTFEHAGDASLIAPSPTTDLEVYLATYDGNLYASLDGGYHKARLATGFDQPYLEAILPIASGLYVGTGDLSDQGRAPRGVLRSTDGGATWARADEGLPRRGVAVASLAVTPEAEGTVYAGTWSDGLFKSTDGAQTWVEAAGQPTGAEGSVTALGVDPADASVAYAIGGSALYKSTDGATTWDAVETLPGDSLLGVSIDPGDGGVLYLGTDFSGVLKSTDAGMTWSTVLAPGSSLEHFDAPAVAPSDPDRLYTAVWGQIFKSTDQGLTWAALGSAAPGSTDHLAVDPRDPNTVYAGEVAFACPSSALRSPLDAAPALEPDLFRSTDGGATWASPTGLTIDSDTTALALNPVDPSVIYVAVTGSCGFGGMGMYVSRDAGITWTLAGAGLPVAFIDALSFEADGSRLYAATGEGVFAMNPGAALNPVPWQPPLVIPVTRP